MELPGMGFSGWDGELFPQNFPKVWFWKSMQAMETFNNPGAKMSWCSQLARDAQNGNKIKGFIGEITHQYN
jgi:hypothetical protein